MDNSLPTNLSHAQFQSLRDMQLACQLEQPENVMASAMALYVYAADKILSASYEGRHLIFISKNVVDQTALTIPLTGGVCFFGAIPDANDLAISYQLAMPDDVFEITQKIMTPISATGLTPLGLHDIRELFGEAMDFFYHCLLAVSEGKSIGYYEAKKPEFIPVYPAAFNALNKR